MKKHPAFSALRITSIVLLFIVSPNVLAAGFSFLTDPSGGGLGITTAYLKSSAPFKDYFIPGFVLFTVIGVLSFCIAVMAVFKLHHYPLLLFVQGCILVGWIVIQLLMVTIFHPLHLIIGLIGILIILSGWLINQKQVTW